MCLCAVMCGVNLKSLIDTITVHPSTQYGMFLFNRLCVPFFPLLSSHPPCMCDGTEAVAPVSPAGVSLCAVISRREMEALLILVQGLHSLTCRLAAPELTLIAGTLCASLCLLAHRHVK